MTQKDKALILKDLCARLPYGVMVNAQYKDGDGWKTEGRRILGIYEDEQVYLDCVHTTVDCIKPYLRPMSSMADEEKREYNLTKTLSIVDYPTLKSFDWLNAHHFDYRGLIERGLAIEVNENNNPYKN